jgi:hypothetical protein
MASVPVPNVVMAELLQGLGGETIENTLYFDVGAAVTPLDLTALGEMLTSWWEDMIRPQISSACSLLRIELTDLTGPLGPATTHVAGLPISGANAGEPVSSNVAPAISFHTASRGRSFRGRNYISGLPDAGIVGNVVAGVVIAALTTGYADLKTRADTLGFPWVVVSRYSGVDPVTKKPIPRASGIATPVLTASFADNFVDSQRRRLPNH